MSFWEFGKKKFSFRDLLLSSKNPTLPNSDDGNSMEEPPKNEVMTKKTQDSHKSVEHIGSDGINKESAVSDLETFTTDQLFKTNLVTSKTSDTNTSASYPSTDSLDIAPDTEPLTDDDDKTLEAPLRELFDESYAVDPLIASLMERVDNIKAEDLAKDLQDLARTLKENASDQ